MKSKAIAYVTTEEVNPAKGFTFHGQWTDDGGTYYMYKLKEKKQ